MKTSSRGKRCAISAAVACFGIVIVNPPEARAISFTWNGNTGNYSDSTQWASGSAPTGTGTGDVLNFAGTTAYTATNDYSISSIPAFYFGEMELDSKAAAGQIATSISAGGIGNDGAFPNVTTLRVGAGSTASIDQSGPGAFVVASPISIGLGATLNITASSGSGQFTVANLTNPTTDAAYDIGGVGTLNVVNNQGTAKANALRLGDAGDMVGVVNITAGYVLCSDGPAVTTNTAVVGTATGNVIGETATLNVAAGATFDFDSNGESVGLFTGSGTIIQGTASALYMQQNLSGTWGGNISAAGSFTLDITNGNYIYTWTGKNTFAGTSEFDVGQLVLAGAGQLSGTSGLTIADGETFVLDNTQNGNQNITNRINAAATLNLSGTLSLLGAPGTAAAAQQLAAVTIGTTGASTINLQPGAGSTASLVVASIARAGYGSFVDFEGTGTTTLTTAPTLVNGIIGSYATVNGTDWATTAVGGRIVAYTGYDTSANPAAWAATDNIKIIGPLLATATNTTLNSLNFASNQTLTLGATTTLNLSSGGILSSAGGTITGGTLMPTQATDPELVFDVAGGQTLLINSIVGKTLTKVGGGTLVLTGANSYGSNGTRIYAGTVSVTSDLQLGTEAVTAIGIKSGGAGYVSAPVVTITGGGGSGATATAVLTSGVVTAITITSGGTGYSSPPTVTLSGGTPTTAATISTDNIGGPTTLSNGTFQVTGSSFASGHLINLNGIGNTIDTGTNTVTLSNYIQGSGGFTKTGTGTLQLTGSQGVITATGPIHVAQGALNTGTASGTLAPDLITVDPGAALDLSYYTGAQTVALLGGTGQVRIRAGQTLNVSDYSIPLGSSFAGSIDQYTAGIASNSSNSSVNYSFDGVLTLSGTSSYHGTTQILAGTVVLDASATPAVNGPLGNSTGLVYLGTTATKTASDSGLLVGIPGLSVGRNIRVYGAGDGNTGVISLGSSTAGSSAFSGSIEIDEPVELATPVGGQTTFSGSITGIGGVVAVGGGMITLAGNNTYTGVTAVGAGTLVIPAGASISSPLTTVASGAFLSVTPLNAMPATSTLAVSGDAVFAASNTTGSPAAITLAAMQIAFGTVTLTDPVNHTDRTLLTLGSLTLAGTADAWNGTLDLNGNDLLIHNTTTTAATTTLSTTFTELQTGYNAGNWNGPNGIISTRAGLNPQHLTAIGVASGLTMFDGATSLTTDVLVKYTYYGDANLDGQVDGSDYTLIDNGFNNVLTGWQNGDFNYDGVVDGSDYTLIDNAFNAQGGNLTSTDRLATTAVQVAGTTAVPEPTSIGILAGGTIRVLLRRRKRLASCARLKPELHN